MNIVHPPYITTQHWYDKIADNLTVPEWQPLSEMHPCALQSSMLKGCIPDAEGAEDFYSLERRRNVRRVYLAMIAEFDAMVGEYITAVADAGLMGRTIFVVTSDHGDMDMEQQQFCASQTDLFCHVFRLSRGADLTPLFHSCMCCRQNGAL